MYFKNYNKEALQNSLMDINEKHTLEGSFSFMAQSFV